MPDAVDERAPLSQEAEPARRPNQPREAPSAEVKTSVNLNVYAAATSHRLSRAVAQLPERVYVPNTMANTVDVIDPQTYAVVSQFGVGERPHHVTPSWDLKHLYVDNTNANSLTVVDPRSGRPIRTIPVDDPYNLYFTLDGRRAIVVAELHQRLDFRDPNTWRLIKAVKLPGKGPDHLDFTADGRFLLVSEEFSGHVVKVDTIRMRVVASLHVGGSPVDVKLAPDGSVFYVANQKRNGVSLIDAAVMREVGFIRTGRGAHGLSIDRSATKLFVSNRLDGSISVISFRLRSVVATWRVGGSPDMLQVSPDGRTLWLSNRWHGSVTVVATKSGRIVRTIAVGAGPHGLSYFPAPGRFSLGHNGVYR